MISFHTKHLLLLLFFACNTLCVSGTSDNNCTTLYSNSTNFLPLSVTTLNISYPSTLSLHTDFYTTTSGDITVEVIICSSDTGLLSTFSNLLYALSAGSDGTVSLTMTEQNSGTTMMSTSAGGRVAASVAVLFGALFSSLFLFKSRVSVLLIVVLFCFALSQAQSTGVTIRVGLPSQITQVCVNGQCGPPSLDSPTSAPTNSPSSTGSTGSTSSAGSTGSAGSTSTPSSTTGGPTVPPTNPPTQPPTPSPTPAPPTQPPSVTYSFKLKVLILGSGKKSMLGADFATLAFDMVGMPYDFVTVNSTTDLSTYLSTSGVGAYSGIVTVLGTSGGDILTADQNTLVNSYQKKYNVKLVVVNSLSASVTLPGLSIAAGTNNEYYQVTLATEFAQYGQFLNQSISVNTNDTILWSPYQNTPCHVLTVSVTDSTVATPVLYAYPQAGQTVAAAVIHMTDGTSQLRYFMQQGADYIHSMAFASLMVNWISPGGVFIGMRRLIFTVNPDDLFLGSYVWNLTTHSNPVTADAFFYRITADDLQTLADFFDYVNPKLPAGSYVTVEWPTNFGGVNSPYYLKGAPVDDLYNKALQIIDKFYYLSHTWDHPCVGAPEDFDHASPDDAYTLGLSELGQNLQFMPGFFGNKQYLWSNNSMITPCVTGLHNSGLLRAMAYYNVTATVSDESVTNKTDDDYEPLVAYHGQWSTMARNGFEGAYFVPRQALDIDYCARIPEDCMDEWNVTRDDDDPTFATFEEYMQMERMIGIQYLVAFRWDPYMLHQTNAMAFTYNDPDSQYFGLGSSYTTSLVALWMQKVLGDIMLYYSLPIVTKQMDDLKDMFIQRQTMDECKIDATLGISAANEIVDITVTSASACTMTLSGISSTAMSGPAVEMESVGVETTAYVDLAGAGNTQQYIFSSPISL